MIFDNEQNTMAADKILNFLTVLNDHNDRDWFNTHKAEYEVARKQMEELTIAVIEGVRRFDGSIADLEAKDAIFRIYRDTRFSKDKTPYKTHMGAFVAVGGRKSHGPGYYFHIDPKESFLGGGIYMPESQLLKSIRHEIYDDYEGFLKVLNDKQFQRFFQGLAEMDDKLKKAPKDFPADFVGIEMLKHKSYFCEHRLAKEQLLSPGLAEYIVEGFRACAEFNRFLSKAV
jgi:uncharacterized protein (TIGR02453 family)